MKKTETSWVCSATLEFDYRLGWVWLVLSWGWVRALEKKFVPEKNEGPETIWVLEKIYHDF